MRLGVETGFGGLFAMALSVDLRERVLLAHERREGSQRVLAERFAVALGTVNGWLRLARAGQRAPRQGCGGQAPLGGTGVPVLAALVAERNDATLAQYAEMLEARVGRRFDPTTLCRALQRLDLPRKKDAARQRAGAARRRRRARGLAPNGDRAD
jgi:transposase